MIPKPPLLYGRLTALLCHRWFWFAFASASYLLCWDVYILILSKGKAWPLCAGSLLLATMPLTLRLGSTRALRWMTAISLLCLPLLVPLLMFAAGTFSVSQAIGISWIFFVGSLRFLPGYILIGLGFTLTRDLPIPAAIAFWIASVAVLLAGAFGKRFGERWRTALFAALTIIVLLSLRGCVEAGF